MTREQAGKAMLYAAGGLLGAGMAGSLYSIVAQDVVGRRVGGKLRRANEENGATPGQLLAEGVLPGNSVVISDRAGISDALRRQIDEESGAGPLKRALMKLTVPRYTSSVMSGANAVYLGRRGDVPVFGFPSGRIDRRMVLHEVGHHLASMKRKDAKAYTREYMRGIAGEVAPRNYLASPYRTHDGNGNLTRYGMENEAWELSGVPEGDDIRRAALGSYRASAVRRRVQRLAILAMLGGLGLGVAGLRMYSRPSAGKEGGK